MLLKHSVVKTRILVGLICGCLIACLLVTAIFVRLYFNRPPYLLMLEPHGEGTLVQFIQPIGLDEKMEVSPKFKIDVPSTEPFQAVLTNSSVAVPGATIEHGDTTILPGAFHIRFGDSLFQLLPPRIIVNGQDYDWSKKPIQFDAVIPISTN
jgi:hypothetical protein